MGGRRSPLEGEGSSTLWGPGAEETARGGVAMGREPRARASGDLAALRLGKGEPLCPEVGVGGS